MKIKCVDGVLREFVSAESIRDNVKTELVVINTMFDKASIPTNKQAYCTHCRQQLGFINCIKDKELFRQHTCNKHYNHEHNLKRLQVQ